MTDRPTHPLGTVTGPRVDWKAAPACAPRNHTPSESNGMGKERGGCASRPSMLRPAAPGAPLAPIALDASRRASTICHWVLCKVTWTPQACAAGRRKRQTPLTRSPHPHRRSSPSAAPKAAVAQAAGTNHIATGETATPYDNFKFAPIREATVSRAMTSRYFKVRGGERGRKRERKNGLLNLFFSHLHFLGAHVFSARFHSRTSTSTPSLTSSSWARAPPASPARTSSSSTRRSRSPSSSRCV